jgi:two-component system NtrC family sensor kinase
MMNKLFILIFLLLTAGAIQAQNKRIDSLIAKIDQLDDLDKGSTLLLQVLAVPHGDYELIKKEKQNLASAEAKRNVAKQLHALYIIVVVDFQIHDLSELLNVDLKGIRISRVNRNTFYLRRFLEFAGLAYALNNDIHEALNYSLKAVSVAEEARDTTGLINTLSNVETDYADLKKSDSALYYARRELMLSIHYSKSNMRQLEAQAFGDMGEAMNSANQPDSSLKYFRKVLAIEKVQGESKDPEMLNIMTKLFLKKGQPDSAAKFGLESYKLLLLTKRWDLLANACAALSKVYEGRDDKKSLYYLKALIAANDSSRSNINSAQFQLIKDKDQQYDQELLDAREKFNGRVRLYTVAGTALVLMLIGIILWRNYRRQKQNNFLLNKQKEEIAAQRDNLGITLEKLKTTQTQLIQSEKMASLGELTAGIAHEIQNPLNFVNNFSEVNKEMIDELKEELKGGNIDEAIAIADDIGQNEEKINHHGKRADAIVKGMLEHSRTNTGQKEPTDINALADEYLRLSYHGLRAKDKNFNAELVTNFDESLLKVNLIPQDIGRVLLNLFNNAFYAVNQKKKTAGDDYKPEVEVSTSVDKTSIRISVKDNGNGIPDAITDKIMQPFFTTKPTGEGTGLGLSLAYDMVVKGHGGSIQVNSEEREGSEFIILLPTN